MKKLSLVVAVIMLLSFALPCTAFAQSKSDSLKVKDVVDNKGNLIIKSEAAMKPYKDSGLQSIGSYANLISVLAKSHGVNVTGSANDKVSEKPDAIEDSVQADMAPEVPATDEGLSGSGGHSETNVQVEGVDEAEIIKTDGKNIYYVNGENYYSSGRASVVIFSAGAKPSAIAKIKLDYIVTEMYLYKNKLVLLGQHSDYYTVGNKSTYKNTQMIDIYDVSNAAKPKAERSLQFEGSNMKTRFIDGHIYFVANKYSYYMPLYTDTPIMEYIPVYWDSIKSKDAIAVPADDIYINPYASSFSMLTVGSLDVMSKETANIEMIIDEFNDIYMNKNALYITSTEYKSNNVNTRILRYGRVDNKLYYSGRGSVSGRLLNSYSMDEYKGVLRVATIGNNINYVTTLNVNTLKQMAKIALGKDERIYSVRYMGEKAYVVTFRETDPLFVLDLKNPNAPKLLGYLKVPGFSDYLHPFKDNYLIGIGREHKELFVRDESGKFVATGETRDQGMKLSLFDVSDPANPKLVKDHVIGKSWSTGSEANHNPKSIMIDKSKDLFAFSYSTHTWSGDEDENKTVGAVFKVDEKKGFEPLLSHEIINDSNYYYYDGARFCYISNNLYFVTGGQLYTFDYNTYKLVNKLKF